MDTSRVLPQFLGASLITLVHHLVFVFIPHLLFSNYITHAALGFHFPVKDQCLTLASSSGFSGT